MVIEVIAIAVMRLLYVPSFGQDTVRLDLLSLTPYRCEQKCGGVASQKVSTEFGQQ